MNILKEENLNILPPDLIEKARSMSKAYEYLYCIENILRDFLDNHIERKNFIIPASIKRTIAERKSEEEKNKWIALRGNNDFFYIDFKDIGGIINNNWELLKNNFPSQYWIIAKIDDLARCRNLIAHNSYLDSHELNVIKANFNSLLKQLSIKPEVRLANQIEPEDKSIFIKGLRHSKTWTKKQTDEGIEYILEYPAEIEVAPAVLRIFYNQVALCFQICYESDKINLPTSFTIGYLNEYDFKENVVFQVGLYDIDEDGIDELFICLVDNDETSENGIQLNVFKYYPPAFKKHSHRPENWELIGNFDVQMILGDPVALIEKISITIHRYLRGFYYEWTYVRGNFVYTGNF